MVRTRIGAGVDVPRKRIAAMEPAPDPRVDPVGQPVAGPLGLVPTTMEDRKECARESMMLMEMLINDYEESRRVGAPVGLDRVAKIWF